MINSIVSYSSFDRCCFSFGETSERIMGTSEWEQRTRGGGLGPPHVTIGGRGRGDQSSVGVRVGAGP